jgi:Animal haem peroxidase
MPRTAHGRTPSLDKLNSAITRVDDINDDTGFPFNVAIANNSTRFDYLFPELQEPEMLLLESRQTRDALVNLGATMSESAERAPGDSVIPSAYTYLGQFIDHDITLETKSDSLANLSEPDLQPLSLDTITAEIRNGRSPEVDLDNVYFKPAPRSGSRMQLGVVSSTDFGHRPPGKDDANDLPRQRPQPDDQANDRAALIGDARNDENLIIAQLHVAFLRAHNAIVARQHTFDEAKRLLRQHYQWIIVKDFLPRICDPWIVADTLTHGNRFFLPGLDDLFMPLEFSVAAYRFGHSMVRGAYNYNLNFSGPTAASLMQLFSFTAFSGRLGAGQQNFPTLPEIWIIQWENFLDQGTNRARPIDTALSPALSDLQSLGGPAPIETRLAVRNLLRGYLLRLPTGQAVASALQLPILSPGEIEAIAAGVSNEQLAAVSGRRIFAADAALVLHPGRGKRGILRHARPGWEHDCR